MFIFNVQSQLKDENSSLKRPMSRERERGRGGGGESLSLDYTLPDSYKKKQATGEIVTMILDRSLHGFNIAIHKLYRQLMPLHG